MLLSALLFPLGLEAATRPTAKRLRETQKSIRQDITSARERLVQAQTSDDPLVIAQAGKKLLKQELARLDGRIEIARSRVMRAKNIDTKEKERLLQTLDKRDGWISDLTAKLGSITPGKGTKETQQLAEQIRKAWNEEGQEAKFRRTLLETRVLATDNVITLAQQLIKDLEADSTKLKGKEAKIAEINQYLSEAKSHVETSQKARKEAMAKLKSIDENPEQANRIVKSGRAQLEIAAQALSDMDKALKQAASVLKKR